MAVDRLVQEGLFASRSDVARAGLETVIERERQAGVGRAIVAGYERIPQDADDLEWSDAASVANDRRGTVVSTPRQGEVWWAEAEDKRRPVLIVTRSDAVPVLQRLIVAPVSRTVRGIPTEITLGREEGLPAECAASFDDLQPISRYLLVEPFGRLADVRAGEVCRALAALGDC